MKKLLFLDVDGVLNSEAFYRKLVFCGERLVEPRSARSFCPTAAAILDDMMSRVPDMDIVISSCWRVGRTVEELQELFTENGLDGSRIVGRTGEMLTTGEGGRGEEIEDYLIQEASGFVSVVVVDDEVSDMFRMLPMVVQTSPRNGLTLDDADKVVSIFTESEMHLRDFEALGVKPPADATHILFRYSSRYLKGAVNV